jgi:nitrite reductase/ring-hydroxylating ferredoxin subunit
MIMRGISRYIEDLVRSRRPRRFAASEDDASLARTAITLRTARPGSGAPREEFVMALHKKLARELDPPGPHQAASPAASPVVTRRRSFLRVATVTGGVAAAVGAALAGAGAEHALTASSPSPLPNGPGPSPELVPYYGAWLTVANSAQLPEGRVLPFTVGAVTGFLSRAGGQVRAVSGICTHQGCRLILDSGSPHAEPAILACPCHGATFAIDGAVRSHPLPIRLPRLPVLEVREAVGNIQVYAALSSPLPSPLPGPPVSTG